MIGRRSYFGGLSKSQITKNTLNPKLLRLQRILLLQYSGVRIGWSLQPGSVLEEAKFEVIGFRV